MNQEDTEVGETGGREQTLKCNVSTYNLILLTRVSNKAETKGTKIEKGEISMIAGKICNLETNDFLTLKKILQKKYYRALL